VVLLEILEMVPKVAPELEPIKKLKKEGNWKPSGIGPIKG